MQRLIKIGKIKKYKSDEIQSSKLGIGLEKLDRNLFDPSKTYDYLQDLGVKHVRLQSGWERTEKTKGVYDFEWLDVIVDNLLQRGIKPWLCMCYGNGLYSLEANKYFGAVGVPPIFTESERQGWHNYCFATAKHFKGRITNYEVWNEPDGVWCWKHGVNGKEYGQFVIDTSKAIKSVDASAKIIGGAMAHAIHIPWLKDALSVGMAEHIDMYSYHNYTLDYSRLLDYVNILKSVLDKSGKQIKIVQGESGSPSEFNGRGALHQALWSPEKQAKHMLRRSILDLVSEVEFTSHFTTVDMVEALNGTNDNKQSYLDYGYFGVLSAQFDKNGLSIGDYKPKQSYYALQTLCSLMYDVTPTTLPITIYNADFTLLTFAESEGKNDVVSHSFTKPNGASAFVYYKPTNVITDNFQGVVSFVMDTPSEKISLIDLMDGSVYHIPENMIKDLGNGIKVLELIPIKDYPLMITFGEFYQLEK